MEVTNQEDPYELVALVYAGFICEKCNAYEDGKQHEPGATWASMAQVAKDAGWFVEEMTVTEGGQSWQDWTVLCPTCRSNHA